MEIVPPLFETDWLDRSRLRVGSIFVAVKREHINPERLLFVLIVESVVRRTRSARAGILAAIGA